MSMGPSRPIIGKSKLMKELNGWIERVAPSKANVLVLGESGTGKELVARMIHELGPLKSKPFVPVNCGAIPENLIESEMFGHKKGSFTGAVQDKTGLFEAVQGGTLFLDEVGELPLGMQVKLLRAIQERVIRRVGGTEDIRIDVRIIAATNRDLEAAVAAGTFREDLYYRLNVIQIQTPPLRDRKQDLPLLVSHFLKACSKKASKSISEISEEAMKCLSAYPWPGNVRELENVMERAVMMENSSRIEVSSLPEDVQNSAAGKVKLNSEPKRAPGELPSGALQSELRIPAPDFQYGAVNLDSIIGEIERIFLMSALEHAGGVKKKAAELLGISFRSIRYRLKKLGVESDEEGEADSESE